MFPIDKSAIEFAIIVIGFVGGIIYVIAQAVNGKSTKKDDAIAAASRTVQLVNEARAALETKIGDQTLIIIQQGKDIASLQAQVRAKDELIERYLKLLQNRNPEFETYMKQSLDTLDEIKRGINTLISKPTVSINNQPAS